MEDHAEELRFTGILSHFCIGGLKDLPLVEVIRLNTIHITYIDNMAFYRLPSLYLIDLRNNKIIGIKKRK